MGTYVELVAKPGSEAQINAAYAAMTGDPKDFLVYSAAVIRREIAYIHSPEGESQAHMRKWLKTVEDWNNNFTPMREQAGQICVWPLQDDEVEDRKRDIRFVLEHRLLFESIVGLDDARRHELTDFELDVIKNGKAEKAVNDSPTFATLPKGTSKLYQNCVEADRPDVWQAYLAYKDSPNEKNWLAMRNRTLPWRQGHTIWQLCERFAREEDGRDHGLNGRYRDGKIPPLIFVAGALKA